MFTNCVSNLSMLTFLPRKICLELTCIYCMLTIISCLITVLSAVLSLWNIRKKKQIAKQYLDFQLLVKKERESSPELELATTKQIVHELTKRSNIRFILLLPHGAQGTDDLQVEIHSNNISLPMALGMLRATYQGVIDTLRPRDSDEQDD